MYMYRFLFHLSLLAPFGCQKPYCEGSSITIKIPDQSLLLHEPSKKLLSLVVRDATSVKSCSGNHLHPVFAYLLDHSTAEILSLECNVSVKAYDHAS